MWTPKGRCFCFDEPNPIPPEFFTEMILQQAAIGQIRNRYEEALPIRAEGRAGDFTEEVDLQCQRRRNDNMRGRAEAKLMQGCEGSG